MMEMSSTEAKKQEIASWVNKLRKSSGEVMVSNYCYNCLFSGNQRAKTLIVLPDEIEIKGIIAIDKPLSDVELPDIIKIYSKIRS